MLTLNFSEEEIQRLKYEKDFNPCVRIRKRSHVVYLKMSHKMSNESIGRIVCCHRNSVSNWVKSYQSGGISSLFETNYYHPQSQLEQYKVIIEENLNNSPVQSINEAVLRIEEVTGVIRKPTQVRVFLLKHGYRYRKMGQIPDKADTQKQEKWLESLKPYIQEAEKGECHLLFSDAAHFTLSAFVCMVWSICRIFLKTAAGRNRINVFGIVDAVEQINQKYISELETLLTLKFQIINEQNAQKVPA